MLTIDQLNKIAGNKRAQGNRAELLRAMDEWGPKVKLDSPHRVAMFIPNVMHEAGGGRNLKEIWGPTAAQARYEDRDDLGNTQPGDGKRFMGHGWIQTTGRANHRSVTIWARNRFPDAPDFEKNPEKLAEPKWAALSAFWYWSERVPMRFVDTGNHEMVRRRINGGLNGYQEVLGMFDRTAMVMLDRDPESVDDLKAVQERQGIVVDGLYGPMTRAALFRSVYALGMVSDRPAPVDHVIAKKPEPAKPARGGWWSNWWS